MSAVPDGCHIFFFSDKKKNYPYNTSRTMFHIEMPKKLLNMSVKNIAVQIYFYVEISNTTFLLQYFGFVKFYG